MIIVMRGTTCSGKDTFCYEHYPEHTVISSDKIRLELTNDMRDQSKNALVFEELRRRIQLRLRLGCPYTVVNATNLKFKDVVQYIEIAKEYNTRVVVMNINPPTVDELKSRRDKRVKSGGLYVPDSVIERHYNSHWSCADRFFQAESEYDNFKVLNVPVDWIEQDTYPEFSPHALLEDEFKIPFNKNTDYYAIGDVHGCIEEYKELCSIVTQDSKRRNRDCKIIQLGDMIDRGPSFEQILIDDKADYKIMGNHELNFIAESKGHIQCRSNARKVNHDRFDKLSGIDKKQVVDALNSRKMFLMMKNDSGDTFIFTHAPIKNVEEYGVSDYSMLDSTTHSSFCMRSSEVDVNKLQHNVGVKGKVTMFYGHQSWTYKELIDQVNEQENLRVKSFNLDSGCVYGDSLKAMRLNDESIFEVKAKAVYTARAKQ